MSAARGEVGTGAPGTTTTPGTTSGTDAPAPCAPTGPRPPTGLARATAVMAAGTLVSRVLGLVSKSLLAALLGTAAINLAANSFDVANKLPNLIYALVAGGALNAVLVPQIVRADRDGPRGREFLDRLFTMATAGLLLLTVVLTLLATPLISLYTAGEWAAPEFGLAVLFALWCLPQLFFYGVYTLFGQLLNARGSFGPYMWAPVVNNLVVITGLLVFWSAYGEQQTSDPGSWSPAMVALLAGSATLGVAAQAAVLVWPLRRIGFSWRPRWGLRGVGFRSAGVVAGWTFAGIVVSQLVFVLVSQVGARALAETRGTAEAAVTASNAAWSFAFLLYMLPHGLVAVSLVTALFTRVSQAAHAADHRAVAAQTRSSMRVLLVGMALPAVGLGLFGVYMTALLFGQTGAQAAVVGQVVIAMAVGLPFFSVLYLVRRVFYAYEDGRTPFVITLVTAGVWAAGTVATQVLDLPPSQWVALVALSMSVGEIASLLVALALLHRRVGGGLGLRGLAWVLARVTAVMLVVAPVALVLGQRAGGVDDRLEALVSLLVGGTVLVVGYVVGTHLLRVRETTELVRGVAARFARAGGTGSRRA